MGFEWKLGIPVWKHFLLGTDFGGGRKNKHNFYVVNVPSMAALKLPVLSELRRVAYNLSLAGTGQLQEATDVMPVGTTCHQTN